MPTITLTKEELEMIDLALECFYNYDPTYEKFWELQLRIKYLVSESNVTEGRRGDTKPSLHVEGAKETSSGESNE